MRNLISLYLVCFSLFVQSSCSNNQQKNETNSMDFNKYEMDSIYHLFGDTVNPFTEIQLSLNYPVAYENQSVLDSLQRLVTASLTTNAGTGENPEEIMRKFITREIEEYRLLEKDFENVQSMLHDEYEEVPVSFSSQYISRIDSVFNKAGIFCFSNKSYQIKVGAANGFERALYTCVDLNTGSVITNETLFIDDFDAYLSPVILEKLVEKHNLTSPVELEKNGFFDILDIRPNNNFYLNEKGITYVYNPIEIAAHSIGISEVFIPWGDVSFLLKEESPAKSLSLNN